MTKQLNLLIEWNNIDYLLLKEESKYLLSFKEDSIGFIEKIKEAGRKMVHWFKEAFNNFKNQYNEFKANKKINMYKKVVEKYKNDVRANNNDRGFKLELYDVGALKRAVFDLQRAIEKSPEEIEKKKAAVYAVIAKRKIQPVFLDKIDDAVRDTEEVQKLMEQAAKVVASSCKSGISEGNKLGNSNDVESAGKIKTILAKLKNGVMNGIYIMGITMRVMLGMVKAYFVGTKYTNNYGRTIPVKSVLY